MRGTQACVRAFREYALTLRATETSSQPAAQEIVAQAGLGGEADGVHHAVDPTPPFFEVVANGVEMLGHRHVELEHGRRHRELASRALGEREAPARPGEHDLGPFLLRELCDAERERCISEHAGDDDALSLEKTHGASDRRCGGDVTAEPGVQG